MDLFRIRVDYHQLCRFCLSKEKCIRIFTAQLELNKRLSKLLDILLAKIDEDDGLPNNICEKCMACIEQFVEFEETCVKSYEVLGKALSLPIDNGCDTVPNSDPESSQGVGIFHNGSDGGEEYLIVKPIDNNFDSLADAVLESFQKHEMQEDGGENPEEYLIDKPTDNDSIVNSEPESFQENEMPEVYDNRDDGNELESIERLEDEQISIIEEHIVLQNEGMEDIPEEDRENAHESYNLTTEQQQMMDSAMEVQPTGFIDRGNRKVPLVECLYCKNVYRGRNTLKKHLRIHLNIKDKQCAYCPKTFTDRSSLRIHENRHTGKAFKCSHCERSYFSQNELRQHLTMQHMERRYTCETCQRKFPSRTILNDHYRVHRPERPFVCKQCGAGFKRNRNLVRHMLVHKKENNELKMSLNCPLCSSCFDLPVKLSKHLRIKHIDELDTIRTGSFKCSQCDEGQFDDLLESLNHEHTHYAGTETTKNTFNPISCGECGKKFKSRPAAMNHMLKHEGSGCYSCFDCEENKRRLIFKELSHLETHRKEVHS